MAAVSSFVTQAQTGLLEVPPLHSSSVRAAAAGNGNQQPTDIEGYSSVVQSAFKQWHELINRMLVVFSQQFSAATGEIQ